MDAEEIRPTDADVVAGGDHLQLDPDVLEMGERIGPAHRTIGNRAEGFARPFDIGLVERVLERGGDRAVVFGQNKDVAVEAAHLFLPGLGMGVLRGGPGVRGDLGKEGQAHVAQVEHLDIDVAAGLGPGPDPVQRDVGETGRAGRAHDDGDPGSGHDGSAGQGWDAS